jgi:hypothetical protein
VLGEALLYDRVNRRGLVDLVYLVVAFALREQLEQVQRALLALV